jgi:hypothetical protein
MAEFLTVVLMWATFFALLQLLGWAWVWRFEKPSVPQGHKRGRATLSVAIEQKLNRPKRVR